MKYNAVIFDMDGTLLDTLGDLTDSANYALCATGFPERTQDEIKSFVGNGVERLITLCLPSGAAEEDYLSCLEKFKAHYAANSRVKTKPYDGVLELLASLKETGVKTGVVSNKFHTALTELCGEFFGTLIGYAVGEKTGVAKKPAPECVFECMSFLRCKNSETLFVGDSDIDILTAKNARLDCAGVSWGFCGEELLKSRGADYIVRKPLEILKIVNGGL